MAASLRFDLDEANFSTWDRRTALGIASILLAATSAVIALGLVIVVGLAGSSIDSGNLLILVSAAMLASAGGVGAYLIRSNLALVRSMTVDERAIQLAFHDGSQREVRWSDPEFEVELIADTARRRPSYVMYGRSWGRLLIVSRQAFEAVLGNAESRGMRIRRTGFGSRGALHLELMPAASEIIPG